MRAIQRIVIHCSASPDGRPDKMEDVRRWHIEGNGWSDIGYHYVIEVDGALRTGRPEEQIGAHSAGNNMGSLGVCLIGTYRFSPAQWDSAKKLVKSLLARFPKADVLGHRDLQGVRKPCPGFAVRQWVKNNFVPEPENVL